MRASPKRQAERAGDGTGPAARAPATSEPPQVDAREPSATIAELQTQALRFRAVIDNISQGVCYFGGDNRLIFSNRRYADIYRLPVAEIAPGCALREIVERRGAAGGWRTGVEDYLAWCADLLASGEPRDWIAELDDGRKIQVRHQPMPDGGWVATHEDVTELQEGRALASERISLQTLIDLIPDYLCVKDAEGRFVLVNKALASYAGRARTCDMIGLTDFAFHGVEEARGFLAAEREILATGRAMIDREELNVDPSGAPKWFSLTKLPVRGKTNEIIGLVGVSRDVTARKLGEALHRGQAEILEMIATGAPLENVLERLASLVESQLSQVHASILLIDNDGLRPRDGAAPGLDPAYVEGIEGAGVGPKVDSYGMAAYRRQPVVVADIARGPPWRDFRDLAGAHGYRSCWSTPILAHHGQALGALALYSESAYEPTPIETGLVDLATRIAGIAIERKLTQERIQFMANHDALTGLPSRALLKDRLAQALLHAERYCRWATVAFVGLDNLKFVNDSLGRNAGDELLKAVAKRLVGRVGATDVVARLAGDEFVVLFFDRPKSPEIISDIVREMQRAIAEPVTIEGHAVRVTSSVGVAIYPKDGADAEALLANADAAMYRAKEVGRDNFQFYTPELNLKVHEKFLLQDELRNAIAKREFALFYQPQVDLATGEILAVEALIRWNHPASGLVAPVDFIPLAEETGLIVPIGEWALREACRQNKAWQNAGLAPIRMAVNVSARQFREKNLVAAVAGALRESGLKAKYLELELTESLIMQDVERGVATMAALRGLGAQLAIDDFGTGYSSLSALKKFPVARLKIDRSFIKELTNNENDRAIAKAIISLGQKLELKVIAEGVETEGQIAFLRKNDCDEAQGYYFSRPIPASEFEQLLARRLMPGERGATIERIGARLRRAGPWRRFLG